MGVILPWADAHNVGYAAWTWDTWSTCSGLVSSYSGTPNTSAPAGAKYSQYIHDHILALSRSRMPVPQGAPTSPGSRGGLAQSTPTALPPR